MATRAPRKPKLQAPAATVAEVAPVTPEPGTFRVDPEKHVVIRGAVYEREKLDPGIQQAINYISWVDQHLATQQQQVNLLVVGRQKLLDDLVERIEESEAAPIGTIPAPAEEVEEVPA